MTLVENALFDIIRIAINTIVDIDGFTIKAKQDANRPRGAYADINLTTITRVGLEEEVQVDRDEDPDIDSTVEGYRELLFSINFYREGAKNHAMAVQTGLVRNSILEAFRAADLGLVTRSEVRDISESLENGWEERAQFDLIMSAIGTDDDIIRSIQIVNIEGNFETRGTSIPITVGV